MRLKSRNKCLFYKPTPTPLHWRGSNRNLFLDFKRITLVSNKLTLNNFNKFEFRKHNILQIDYEILIFCCNLPFVHFPFLPNYCGTNAQKYNSNIRFLNIKIPRNAKTEKCIIVNNGVVFIEFFQHSGQLLNGFPVVLFAF